MNRNFGLRIVSVSLIYTLFATSILDAQIPGFGNKVPIPGLNPSDAINKFLEEQVGKSLGGGLPLTLDAKNVYPTVSNADLPGGPFKGKLLNLTLTSMMQPLPPGDYVVPMTFFCSQYSIHQPGRGFAYTLGPAEGRLGAAISTLLWRGMIVGKSTQELQMISWAIQGSVPYSQMPEDYKKTIDQLVPEFKNDLNGQGIAKIQNDFNSAAADKLAKYNNTVKYAHYIPAIGKLAPPVIKMPTFDGELEHLAEHGHEPVDRLARLALDGMKLAKVITANYTSEQLRRQTVFAGQGSALQPVPAESGPWTVKIPSVAYMRFRVVSGNMASDNQLEIRVLPSANSETTAYNGRPHLVLSSFEPRVAVAVAVAGSSFVDLFGATVERRALGRCLLTGEDAPLCVALTLTLAGTVGYAINHGAQSPLLAPPPLVPSVPATPQAPVKTNSTAQTRKYANQICDDDVLDKEQAAMENVCSAIVGLSCNPKKTPLTVRNQMACSDVQAKIAAMQECLRLRKRVQQVCFATTDKGHQDQMDQLQVGIGYCYALAAVNCAPGHPMANK